MNSKSDAPGQGSDARFLSQASHVHRYAKSFHELYGHGPIPRAIAALRSAFKGAERYTIATEYIIMIIVEYLSYFQISDQSQVFSCCFLVAMSLLRCLMTALFVSLSALSPSISPCNSASFSSFVFTIPRDTSRPFIMPLV